MKTVRRLLYRDVVWSVVFVALAFLSLFFFIDFLDALEKVGRRGQSVWLAALYTLLEVPGRLYELMPIAVLIGTIYAMARLAQSSEFTILRTGGLGPGRALSLLLNLGLVMSAITFVTGEYVTPWAEQSADSLRTRAEGGSDLGRIGAWLREHRQTPQGVRVFTLNVRGVQADGELQDIHIFEHDAQGLLHSRLEAASGRLVPTPGEAADHAHTWQLRDVRVTRWPLGATTGEATLLNQHHTTLAWPTTLSANVVEAAVSSIDSMSTLDLWRYSRHLNRQEQTAQRYELQFWRRVLYPFACIVMMALALPFAYLHARAGGVSFKVFGGIMLGISFVLLNNVAGHLGLLNNWTPWLAASAPSALYLGLSLAAFGWLVRYR